MTYTGYRLAISKYLKCCDFSIDSNDRETMNACLRKIHSVSKGSQVYYDILEKNTERPKCCNKWEDKFNDRTIDWGKCFYYIHKINDINMKWFQIRIVHRIIGTNVLLKHMGLTQSENCSFCNCDKESIEHIFWRCTVSRHFWDDLVNLVNEKCPNSFNFRLSESLVILGIDRNIKIDSIFAFILIFAKQYLYKCKLDKLRPDISILRKKLLFRYKIEEFNARIRLMYPDFAARWHSYKGMLPDDNM